MRKAGNVVPVNPGLDPEGEGRPLPYRIDVVQGDAQTIVATTLDAIIGFASYYAAIRTYPAAIVTLSRQETVVSRHAPSGGGNA